MIKPYRCGVREGGGGSMLLVCVGEGLFSMWANVNLIVNESPDVAVRMITR